MIYLNNYKTFLSESKSISTSCEKLHSILEKELIHCLKKFTQNDDQTFIFNYDADDFKIKNLQINLILRKADNNRCNALAICNSFENGYVINPSITFTININKLTPAFITYFDSSILHELLHIFQFYCFSGKSKFRPTSWSIGVVVSKLLRKENSSEIHKLLMLLYYSLSHEIAAQLHQYYFYKKQKLAYKTIFMNVSDLLSFKPFKLTEKLENELNNIKLEISNSIKYYGKNKQYLKDLNKSLWLETNNETFLEKLKMLFTSKADYINNKIIQVNKIFDINEKIDYSESGALPFNFGTTEYFQYIDENNLDKLLNDLMVNFL